MGLLIFFTTTLGLISTKDRYATKDKTETIYLASNGVHTDLILPAEYVAPALKTQFKVNSAVKYVAYGWGDQGFYLHTAKWADLKFSTAWKALFLKSPTAMHISRHSTTRPHWSKVSITKEQLTTLKMYLNSGFQISDADQKYILIPNQSYSTNDQFFQGTGSYSIFCTCNEWVNRGLKKIGCKTAYWSPFDWGIFRHLPNSKEKSLD